MLSGMRAGPRVGEIDGTVRFHHNVVGAVESATLETAGNDRYAAVSFQTGYAAAVVFCGDQTAL